VRRPSDWDGTCAPFEPGGRRGTDRGAVGRHFSTLVFEFTVADRKRTRRGHLYTAVRNDSELSAPRRAARPELPWSHGAWSGRRCTAEIRQLLQNGQLVVVVRQPPGRLRGARQRLVVVVRRSSSLRRLPCLPFAPLLETAVGLACSSQGPAVQLHRTGRTLCQGGGHTLLLLGNAIGGGHASRRVVLALCWPTGGTLEGPPAAATRAARAVSHVGEPICASWSAAATLLRKFLHRLVLAGHFHSVRQVHRLGRVTLHAALPRPRRTCLTKPDETFYIAISDPKTTGTVRALRHAARKTRPKFGTKSALGSQAKGSFERSGDPL
jgi:hypothetical protein